MSKKNDKSHSTITTSTPVKSISAPSTSQKLLDKSNAISQINSSDENEENETDREEMVKKLLGEIKVEKFLNVIEFAEGLANQCREFFIGVTFTQQYTRDYINHRDIYTTEDIDEAKVMQQMIIHKLMFHKSQKVRAHLGNKMGGSYSEMSAKSPIVIYIAYDAIPKHNLSFRDLQELTKNIIDNKLMEYIENNRMIKIGVTSDFDRRMPKYTTKDTYKNFYEEMQDGVEYKLMSEGDTVTLNGKILTLNNDDIKNGEMMFISQFMFLDYKNHHQLLINHGRGGNIDDKSKSKEFVLYFRLGKRGTNQNDFRRGSDKNFNEKKRLNELLMIEIKDYYEEFKKESVDKTANQFVTYLSEKFGISTNDQIQRQVTINETQDSSDDQSNIEDDTEDNNFDERSDESSIEE